MLDAQMSVALFLIYLRYFLIILDLKITFYDLLKYYLYFSKWRNWQRPVDLGFVFHVWQARIWKKGIYDKEKASPSLGSCRFWSHYRLKLPLPSLTWGWERSPSDLSKIVPADEQKKAIESTVWKGHTEKKNTHTRSQFREQMSIWLNLYRYYF